MMMDMDHPEWIRKERRLLSDGFVGVGGLIDGTHTASSQYQNLPPYVGIAVVPTGTTGVLEVLQYYTCTLSTMQ